MAVDPTYCGPCKYVYTTKYATKWCMDCNAAFCGACANAHAEDENNQNHQFIPAQNNRKFTRVWETQLCRDHHKMEASYFCPEHDNTFCVLCIATNHGQCDDIMSIRHAIKTTKYSKGPSLETNIDTILKNIEKGIWCEAFNQSTLKMKSKSIINEIEVIRDQVNEKLDELEEKLSNECSSHLKILENNIDNLHALERNVTEMKEQTFEMKNFGSEVQNFVGSIVIDEKLAKEREHLVSLMNQIQIFNLELEHKPNIDIYNEPNSFWDINVKTKCNILKFSTPSIVNDKTNIPGNPDPEVNFNNNNNNNAEGDVLEINYIDKNSNHHADGHCETNSAEECVLEINPLSNNANPPEVRNASNTTLNSVRSINLTDVHGTTIHTRTRAACCVILPNKHLIVGDQNYARIIICEGDGSRGYDIDMEGPVCDMTLIDNNQLAVTVDRRKDIYVIDLLTDKIVRKITGCIKNYCRGISYLDGKLYVIDHKKGIKVIDFASHTVSAKLNVEVKHANKIRTACGKVYYTNVKKHELICCELNGKQKWTFHDNGISRYSDFSCDSHGNVVCSLKDSIAVIYDEGTKKKILLETPGELKEPAAIYYYEDDEDNVLLTCDSRNGYAFLYDVITL